MVSGSSPKAGSTCNKITKCENSKKYDSTRLEGVQLQDKHALLKVRVFHHEDVALGSDLKMIPKAVLHLLERLRARKM
jgi:hypothetical protein